MKIAKPNETPPPSHLSKRAAAFWKQLNDKFIFEAHDLERLRTVCDSMDLVDACETAIKKDGRFVPDRYGVPKAHPAIVVARDARQLLLRGLRELCVDVELPEEPRVPRQGRRYA
jgi:phage terminase small subunit